MKKLLVLVAVIVIAPFLVSAREPNSASSVGLLQAQVQDLLKQIQSLQQQVTELKAELGAQSKSTEMVDGGASEASPPELTRTLSRGSSGDDVRELQKFLSRDKEIYPEGLITGYFGLLTEAAVKRWQAKRGVEVVGNVGKKTIAHFKELREQSAAGIPSTLTTPAVSAQSATITPSIASTTSAGPTCGTDYLRCGAKADCEKAGFFWYTVSCHKSPPRQGSCAESYMYCAGPDECAAQGWYWCRNTCNGSADACIGQVYVPPAVPVTPAIPAQPVGQTGTTTVSATPAQPATATAATTTSADTTAPSAPTNLTATALTAVYIDLRWTASTDAVGVVGYRMYRGGTYIATVPAGASYSTSYSDSGIAPATSYSYTVAAYDAANNMSAPSATLSVTTLGNTCSNLTFALQDNKTTYSVGETGYVTYSCPSVITVHMEIVKPDGTIVHIGGHTASSGIDGFGTGSFSPGAYTARACYGTYTPTSAASCQSVAASVPFTITSGTSAPQTATTTSSFDIHSRNLAAITRAFTAIQEQLLGLLQELNFQR